MELVRCRHEIAGIEAELHAGNPDILGLLMAYADWHAELQILQDDRAERDEGETANKKAGGGDHAVA